jgi:hypothetical protein
VLQDGSDFIDVLACVKYGFCRGIRECGHDRSRAAIREVESQRRRPGSWRTELESVRERGRSSADHADQTAEDRARKRIDVTGR